MVSAIDTMFEQLLVAPTWATTIAGLLLVLGIIFLGATVFGKSKQPLDAFAFSILTFVGIVIGTSLGLFPWYILVIFLIVGLVIILLSKIFGENRG